MSKTAQGATPSPKVVPLMSLLFGTLDALCLETRKLPFNNVISGVNKNKLKDWMDFRESYGERITGESWLMRNMWRTADMQPDKCGRIGLATVPA